jgi:hypothetical protein
MNRRQFLRLTAAALAALFPACAGQAPGDAEKDVRAAAAAAVRPLTAAALNDLFLLRREGKSLPYGTVYEVTGRVRAVTLREKQGDQPERFGLELEVPDYAAAKVLCHFAAAHKERLGQVQVGQTASVRGKLSSGLNLFGDSAVDLNGCVFTGP